MIAIKVKFRDKDAGPPEGIVIYTHEVPLPNTCIHYQNFRLEVKSVAMLAIDPETHTPQTPVAVISVVLRESKEKAAVVPNETKAEQRRTEAADKLPVDPKRPGQPVMLGPDGKTPIRPGG